MELRHPRNPAGPGAWYPYHREANDSQTGRASITSRILISHDIPQLALIAVDSLRYQVGLFADSELTRRTIYEEKCHGVTRRETGHREINKQCRWVK
jgi:hypothetical protein